MKSFFIRSGSISLGFRLIHQVAFLSTVILSLMSHAVFAGSATWNSTNGYIAWEYDLNWLPNTIPNDPGDVATFGSGTTPFANPTSTHNIDSMVFAPGAGVYTITVFSTHFELSGAGIVNNSAVLQNFIVPASAFPDGEEVFYITGAASAGNLTQITNQNGDNDAFGGILDFEDESTAGTATIYNLGSPEVYNGLTLFYGSSSAGAATITNQPGMFYAGGGCGFNDTSNAGTATIINNAATVSNGAGGGVAFADSSSAAHSTSFATATRREVTLLPRLPFLATPRRTPLESSFTEMVSCRSAGIIRLGSRSPHWRGTATWF